MAVVDWFAELKRVAERCGYRFELDADGTERMIRPNGTAVVIGRTFREGESLRWPAGQFVTDESETR